MLLFLIQLINNVFPQNILNCSNEFPTGLIVISDIPSEDIEGGFINQIQYINVLAGSLFNIS